MNLKSQKLMASKVMKVGVNRIKIEEDGLSEVSEAITRDDIRRLVVHKSITVKPKKSPSKTRLRKRVSQKKKGRQGGQGGRSGTSNARQPKKKAWMNRIRAQRQELKKMKEAGEINTRQYRTLYGQAKGGLFRSRRHLREHIERYLKKE